MFLEGSDEAMGLLGRIRLGSNYLRKVAREVGEGGLEEEDGQMESNVEDTWRKRRRWI